MAMVNMNNLLNGKDSRWLQLEVCREFQRNKCTRPDTECKFAHPPANVEVQNGRVTACYDSIKVSCMLQIKVLLNPCHRTPSNGEFRKNLCSNEREYRLVN
ncbi:protein muscleblind isoform X13 [Diachasmimorpha longicaudata]|uniref:protein muscleblind isoform X13 n=1 Tax=Diachasmimorpha longicaudata TaxID=58733 RepID=UPI0030B8C6F8